MNKMSVLVLFGSWAAWQHVDFIEENKMYPFDEPVFAVLPVWKLKNTWTWAPLPPKKEAMFFIWI